MYTRFRLVVALAAAIFALAGCSGEVPSTDLVFHNYKGAVSLSELPPRDLRKNLKIAGRLDVRHKSDDQPFSGLAVFGAEDRPVLILEFKEGQLNGLVRAFHDNGELREEGYARVENTRPGKATVIRYGEYREWHGNGELKGDGEYGQTGNKIGVWREFSEDGQILTEKKYDDNGQTTGVWREWYGDGQLKRETSYDDQGRKNGVAKAFCSNGQQQAAEPYAHDDLDGVAQQWTCDGQLTSSVSYQHGTKHGSFEIHQQTSSGGEWYLAEKGTYVNGELDGAYTSFASDGSVEASGRFEKGARTGDWQLDGRVIVFGTESFLNLEHQDAFMRTAGYRRGYNVDWRRTGADVKALGYYVKEGLVDPGKRIVTARYPNFHDAVRNWSYPVIEASESGFEALAVLPGVDPGVQDGNGQTRLHKCVVRMIRDGSCSAAHYHKLVGLIDVNLQSLDGRTPLHLALETAYRLDRKAEERLIAPLIEAGANLNSQDRAGRTPLMIALGKGHHAIAENLIAQGADVTLTDKRGHTALRYVFFDLGDSYSIALNPNRNKVLRLLAERGVDLNGPVAGDKNVKFLALKAGEIDTIEYIESLASIEQVRPVDSNNGGAPGDAVASSQKNQPVQSEVPSPAVTLPSEAVKKANPRADAMSNVPLKVEPVPSSGAVSSGSVASLGAPPASVDVPRADPLDALYLAALEDIKAARLTRPAGDSAYDKYQNMRRIAPRDDRVGKVRSAIAARYVELAERKLRAGDLDTAERYALRSLDVEASRAGRDLLATVAAERERLRTRVVAADSPAERSSEASQAQEQQVDPISKAVNGLINSLFKTE